MKDEPKKVAYYEGHLVHVTEALENERRYPVRYKKAVYFERGTGRPMRPVDATTPHFRYLPGEADRSQCFGARGESLAHAKAKEVLLERKEISFTSRGKEYAFTFKGVGRKEEPFNAPISKAHLRIDVVAELENARYPIEGERTLAVEIRIGHEVDEPKKAELRTARYPTIEISLPPELTSYTDENSDHARYEELMRRLRGLLHREVLTHVEWIYPSEYEIRQREENEALAKIKPVPAPVAVPIKPPPEPIRPLPPPPVVVTRVKPVDITLPQTPVVAKPVGRIPSPLPKLQEKRSWWSRFSDDGINRCEGPVGCIHLLAPFGLILR